MSGSVTELNCDSLTILGVSCLLTSHLYTVLMKQEQIVNSEEKFKTTRRIINAEIIQIITMNYSIDASIVLDSIETIQFTVITVLIIQIKIWVY